MSKTYKVGIEFVGSTWIEVEAENEDEAIHLALNEAPGNNFAGVEWDAGDWYFPGDESDDARADYIEEVSS